MSESTDSLLTDPVSRPLASRFSQTFAALSIRNFRLFYSGQGISLVGTWMRRTAMAWFIYEATKSTWKVGMVEAFALMPLLVLSPYAGVLADRFDKRRIVVLTQWVAFAVSAALAAMAWMGSTNFPLILVLATMGGVAFAFEVPSRQAFINELVGRELLMNAIALNSALVNLARVFGPVVGGFLLHWSNAGAVFAIDAASYLVVIWTLAVMRVKPSPVKPRTSGTWEQILGGFREARRNRRVHTSLLLIFVTGVCGWSFATVMPAIVQDVLKLGGDWFGIIMGVYGIGAVSGALYVAAQGTRGRPRLQVYLGISLMMAGLIAASFTHTAVTLALCLMLSGFGSIMFLSTANTVVQTSVSDDVRGRVMGLWSFVFGGSMPLGSLLTGWLASEIGPMPAIRVLAVTCVFITTIIYFTLTAPHPPQQMS